MKKHIGCDKPLHLIHIEVEICVQQDKTIDQTKQGRHGFAWRKDRDRKTIHNMINTANKNTKRQEMTAFGTVGFRAATGVKSFVVVV